MYQVYKEQEHDNNKNNVYISWCLDLLLPPFLPLQSTELRFRRAHSPAQSQGPDQCHRNKAWWADQGWWASKSNKKSAKIIHVCTALVFGQMQVHGQPSEVQ